MQVKADLHVHTSHSPDSLITPADLIFYSRKRGLNAVAITDHNRVGDVSKLPKQSDLLIIPGTEVSSHHGHIVGLNIYETIPRGLSADETVDRIHARGGIAIACHPFALLKGSVGKHVSAKFDAVEVINASAFPFARSIAKARLLAHEFGLPQVAGTDAHYGPQIGSAYTLIDADASVEAVVKAIKEGECEPFGNSVSIALKLQKQFYFYRKKLFHA